MGKTENLIIKMMSEGFTQKEVGEELKKQGISPNSISSIENKLREMRKEHQAKTIVHLFVILKSKKII